MYLLILGSPRSGTTLLASMIGMHTDVAMLIEDKNFAIKKLTSKKIFANKLCIPNQTDISKRATYFTKLKRRIGIKSYPTSRYTIEDYLKLKDIKIITIIRNGYDVINSNKKRGEGREKLKVEEVKAVKWWSRAIDIMHELNEKHKKSVLTVSYEDLVCEPEKILKSICDFLSIDFQENMLEGYKHNKLYPGESKIDKSKAFKSNSSEAGKLNLDPVIREKFQMLSDLRVKP